MMKAKTTGLSLLLILAIAGSWWLTSNIHITRYSAGKPNSGPDGYAMNVRVTTTDSAGNIASYFTSPKLVQYNKDNLTYITQPNITLYGKDGRQKYIRAAHGKSQNNHVMLWGNVVIKQPKANHKNTTITTSKLTYFPEKQLAKTQHPVVITQPGSIVHAVGLETNLATGDTKLLSKVNITYHPKKQ